MLCCLIDRNTTIPTTKSQIFSTAEDNQSAVTIKVFQGEREMAADNKSLGQFDLVGIPPAMRGTPQIEVTFDIDSNGIVKVSAKDKASGKEHQIRIQASGGLTDEDIEKMVKDAEANAEADKQRKDMAEARNHADSLIHETEKNLVEYGDKIEIADKETIEKARDDLKSALEAEDVADVQAKTQVLLQASMKIGEVMYKQQQENAGNTDSDADSNGADASAKSKKNDDDVIDAEYTEVNDKDSKSA